MIAFAVVKGDNFALSMIAGGFFFGAIGWYVAIKFYELSLFPMKNGKYILGKCMYYDNTFFGYKAYDASKNEGVNCT